MGLRGPRSVHSCGDWNWERQVSLFQPWARPDGSEQPQGLWVHRAPTEGAGPALTQWARAGGSLGKDSWRIHLVWVSGTHGWIKRSLPPLAELMCSGGGDGGAMILVTHRNSANHRGEGGKCWER